MSDFTELIVYMLSFLSHLSSSFSGFYFFSAHFMYSLSNVICDLQIKFS